jgi:hypothetical protein
LLTGWPVGFLHHSPGDPGTVGYFVVAVAQQDLEVELQPAAFTTSLQKLQVWLP